MSSHSRYLNFLFADMFIEKFRIKMFKNLLRNHKVDKVDTFHKCLWHYSLYKMFLFCFLLYKNSGCYGIVFIVVVIPGQ